MFRTTLSLIVAAVMIPAISGLSAQPVIAQGIVVSTPFTGISDSYYERMGVNFGFSFPAAANTNGSRIVGFGPGGIQPNVAFSQGSFGGTAPQIGGYNPNASARFGFGRIGPGGGGFNLGFELGKGSTRSWTTTTPSINVQNGFGGSIFSGGAVPFVTSVTPVTGYGYPSPIDNAVTRAIASGQLDTYGQPTGSMQRESRYTGPVNYSSEVSSAETTDISVDAIVAQRERQQSAMIAQINELVRQAIEFEEAGDFYHARKRYREAVQICTDRDLEERLRERMRLVGKPAEGGN
ncbi:MAG: hypothetical protein AAF456_23530 [Planctomycetota bacterium]